MFLLAKFLEEIGYLDDDKSTEAKVSIGRLLITMMESLEYNIHPIVQVGMTSGQVEDIGSALYPVAARYLNHSCDPNTLRVSLGSSVVFVARRNIKAGQNDSSSSNNTYYLFLLPYNSPVYRRGDHRRLRTTFPQEREGGSEGETQDFLQVRF